MSSFEVSRYQCSRFSRNLSCFASFLWLLACPLAPVSQAGNTRYFVDCANGNDGADGLAESTAWLTLTPVNSRTFTAGDRILLRRGTRCSGALTPGGSGTAAEPITIGAWGSGSAPVIDGGAALSVVEFIDQEGWHVEDIETAGGTRFGIHVGANRPLTHFRITNVAVHDVHGALAAKNSGLIVIGVESPGGTVSDVVIDGATAWNSTQWSGIRVQGAHWQTAQDDTHGSHAIVRNSVVHDIWGDGIILLNLDDGLIEKSFAYRTGLQPSPQTIGTPSAIWTWMCNRCTVQYNESWLSNSPDVDGGAYDIDWGNRDNTVQFNYGHESKSYCAVVLGAERITTTNSVVRDNLCIANSQHPAKPTGSEDFKPLTWNGGWIENVTFHHNVSCIDAPRESPVLRAITEYRGLQLKGSARFEHNLAYSTGQVLIDAFSPLKLDHNSYWFTGSDGPVFRFDGKTYSSFEAYREGSGQDAHSKLGPMALPAETATGQLPSDVLAGYRGAPVLVSLLDDSADSHSQSIVLRSMQVQYADKGLKVAFGGTPGAEWPLAGITAVDGPQPDAKRLPATFLISPDGQIQGHWEGYAPAFQVAPRVERVLGAERVPGCPAERAMRLPQLSADAVQHAATWRNGPVAPGQLVRIQGRGIGFDGPGSAVYDQQSGVNTRLAQTRVYFAGIQAPLLTVSDGEVLAQVPNGVPEGEVRVQVQYKELNSNGASVVVAPAAPGIFQLGGGLVLALSADGQLKTVFNPAKRGEKVTFFVTGVGRTVPASADGFLPSDGATLQDSLTVLFGNVPGQVDRFEFVLPGLLKINAEIPLDAPAGNALPLRIRVGDFMSPDGVMLAVQ